MVHIPHKGRGRNNFNISGSQQNYLVGKSGRPQIYVVDIWPRFKQNLTNIPNILVVHRTTAVIIFGSPTKFLVVLGLLDYHYFDPCIMTNKEPIRLWECLFSVKSNK